jgi:hypothetical protein
MTMADPMISSSDPPPKTNLEVEPLKEHALLVGLDKFSHKHELKSTSSYASMIQSKSFPETARLSIQLARLSVSILVSILVKLDTLHFERPPNRRGKFTFVWTP